LFRTGNIVVQASRSSTRRIRAGTNMCYCHVIPNTGNSKSIPIQTSSCFCVCKCIHSALTPVHMLLALVQ
jgi:hypothetical protein